MPVVIHKQNCYSIRLHLLSIILTGSLISDCQRDEFNLLHFFSRKKYKKVSDTGKMTHRVQNNLLSDKINSTSVGEKYSSAYWKVLLGKKLILNLNLNSYTQTTHCGSKLFAEWLMLESNPTRGHNYSRTRML